MWLFPTKIENRYQNFNHLMYVNVTIEPPNDGYNYICMHLFLIRLLFGYNVSCVKWVVIPREKINRIKLWVRLVSYSIHHEPLEVVIGTHYKWFKAFNNMFQNTISISTIIKICGDGGATTKALKVDRKIASVEPKHHWPWKDSCNTPYLMRNLKRILNISIGNTRKYNFDFLQEFPIPRQIKLIVSSYKN